MFRFWVLTATCFASFVHATDIAVVPGYLACLGVYRAVERVQPERKFSQALALVESYTDSRFIAASKGERSYPRPSAVASSHMVDEKGGWFEPLERVPTLGGGKHWGLHKDTPPIDVEAVARNLQERMREGKVKDAYHLRGQGEVRSFLKDLRSNLHYVAVDPQTLIPPPASHPLREKYWPNVNKLGRFLITSGLLGWGTANTFFSGFSPMVDLAGFAAPDSPLAYVFYKSADFVTIFFTGAITAETLYRTAYRPWAKHMIVPPAHLQLVPRVNQMLNESRPMLPVGGGALGLRPKGIPQTREGDYVYWSATGDNGATVHLLFLRGGISTEDQLAVIFDGDNIPAEAATWQDHATRAGAGALAVDGPVKRLMDFFRKKRVRGPVLNPAATLPETPSAPHVIESNGWEGFFTEIERFDEKK